MTNPFFCLVCGKKLAEDMYLNAKFCDNTCRWKYFIIKQKDIAKSLPKTFVVNVKAIDTKPRENGRGY